MVEREPLPGKPARPILDFAVLPDKIGTKEDMVSFPTPLELLNADNSKVLHRALETNGRANQMGGE